VFTVATRADPESAAFKVVVHGQGNDRPMAAIVRSVASTLFAVHTNSDWLAGRGNEMTPSGGALPRLSE
jgi:hypothetical protein